MKVRRADFTNSAQLMPVRVWNPHHMVKDPPVYKGTNDSVNN